MRPLDYMVGTAGSVSFDKLTDAEVYAFGLLRDYPPTIYGTTATVHTLSDGHYFVQFSVNRPQFEVIE